MPINYYIFLSIALFAIGIVGVLTRRNAIIIFMCIELMLNAVNLLLVAFSKMHHLKAAVADAATGNNWCYTGDLDKMKAWASNWTAPYKLKWK